MKGYYDEEKEKNTAKNRKKTSFSHYLLIGIAIYFVTRVSTITYHDLVLNSKGRYAVAEVFEYRNMRNGHLKGCYEFKVNGNWYKGWAMDLSDSKLHKRIPYDTLTIMYLPSNPEINRSKNAVEKDFFVMFVNLFK